MQVLRAAAAIGVMLTHLGAEFHSSGAPGALPNFTLGPAGVDLFFVISGFVMVYSAERLFGKGSSPLAFMRGRLTRIVPLYWIATAIFLGFVLLVQGKSLADADLSQRLIVNSFLFLPDVRPSGIQQPALGVGWTLNYEMLFYVLFACAVWMPRRLAVAAVTLAIAALIWLAPFAPPLSVWSDPTMLEFVFGMMVALAYRQGLRLPLAASIGIGAAAIGLYAASVIYSFAGVPRFVLWGIPSALLVAACALSGRTSSDSLPWRAIAFVGDCSYALYLFHLMSSSIPRRFFPWLVSPAEHPWVFAAMVVTINLVAAVLIHVWIERPLTERLRGRRRAVAVPASA